MAHGATFLAAYILLLSRLWLELERMLMLLQSTEGAVSGNLEIAFEFFRLELLSLRHPPVPDTQIPG